MRMLSMCHMVQLQRFFQWAQTRQGLKDQGFKKSHWGPTKSFWVLDSRFRVFAKLLEQVVSEADAAEQSADGQGAVEVALPASSKAGVTQSSSLAGDSCLIPGPDL